MKAERIVVDSNVLISAALNPDGRPREVMSAIRSENGVLPFSAETFSGLRFRALEAGGSGRGDQDAAGEDRRAGGGAGFFVQGLRSMSVGRRRRMVDRASPALSVSRQSVLLGVSRIPLEYPSGRPLGNRPDGTSYPFVSSCRRNVVAYPVGRRAVCCGGVRGLRLCAVGVRGLRSGRTGRH